MANGLVSSPALSACVPLDEELGDRGGLALGERFKPERVSCLLGVLGDITQSLALSDVLSATAGRR